MPSNHHWGVIQAIQKKPCVQRHLGGFGRTMGWTILANLWQVASSFAPLAMAAEGGRGRAVEAAAAASGTAAQGGGDNDTGEGAADPAAVLAGRAGSGA